MFDAAQTLLQSALTGLKGAYMVRRVLMEFFRDQKSRVFIPGHQRRAAGLATRAKYLFANLYK
jgi:hypothetical protein